MHVVARHGRNIKIMLISAKSGSCKQKLNEHRRVDIFADILPLYHAESPLHQTEKTH